MKQLVMKQLVMKVKHFFNIDNHGEVLTIFGGSLNCNIYNGESVEIHTINDMLRTSITKIKCYDKHLDKALNGLSCGLAFSGIHHLKFRLTEPTFNPFSPKDDLVNYLKWDSKLKDAEGVYVFKEVPDEPPFEKGCERNSERDHPKPNFLFLHGSE